MGVKGLWSLLNPVARPVQIESLEGKKLAIDSSIWLYQFQATMRDKDGRVLVNAHVLGFLRRINKLLFHGIKPVFVFDGGAPGLKRSTIAERKRRKAGAAANHAKTAEKLFAAQMRREAVKVTQAHREAQEQAARDRAMAAAAARYDDEAGEQIPENATYLEDLEGNYNSGPRPAPPRPPPRNGSSNQTSSKIIAPVLPEVDPAEERRKRFRKHDPYKLPEASMPTVSTEEKPDARLATEDELKHFIDSMHPTDIDVESAEFRALPTEVQYEIIGDLRIRSRQQSHKRLADMLRAAPTALDFSMAQIKHLSQRNALTQQLLTVTDMVGHAHLTIPVRIAAERNREYVLVKRGESEGGGWALGIREGTKTNPIKIEPTAPPESPPDSEEDDSDYEDEDDFEVQEIKHVSPVPSSTPMTVDRDLKEFRRREALNAIVSRYTSTAGPSKLPATMEGHDSTPTANDEALALALQQEELGSDEEEADPELARALAMSRQEKERKITTPMTVPDEHEAAIDIIEEKDTEVKAVESDDSLEEVSLVPSGRTTPLDISEPEIQTVETDDEDDLAEVPTPMDSLPEIGVEDAVPQQQPRSEPDASDVLDKVDRALEQERRKRSNLDASIPRPEPTSTRPNLLKSAVQRSSESHGPPPPSHDTRRSPQRSPTPQNQTSPITALKMQPPLPSPQSVNESKTKQMETPPIARPSRVSMPSDSPSRISDVELGRHNSHERSQMTSTKPQVEKSFSRRDRFDSPDLDHDDDLPDEIRLAHRGTVDPFLAYAARDDESEPSLHDLRPSLSRSPSNDQISISETRTDLDNEEDDELGQEEEDEEEGSIRWSKSPSPGPIPRPPLHTEQSGESIPSEVEDEDVDMNAEDMVAENDDYARFLASIKHRDLNAVRTEIDDEIRVLHAANKVAMRDSDEISQAMISQIQTLLRHFGIPYITAPMEAEAQCAKLAEIGLVDGIITDDSDVFLFGGIQCFKNIFNDAKYAECFLLADIDRELSLTRERLISLAYLLGSDYTIGLPGVGPVVALELLANFPGEKGVDDFKTWWMKVQRGQDSEFETGTKWRKSFKKRYSHAIYLTADWPNPLVREAYKYPTTDESKEPFHWGFPKLSALRSFLHEELSWSISKVDDELTPIVQRIARRGKAGALNKQATLDPFFDASVTAGNYAPRRRTTANVSKRLMGVIKQFREAEARVKGKDVEGWGDMLADVNQEDPKGVAYARKGSSQRIGNGGSTSRNSAIPVKSSIKDGSEVPGPVKDGQGTSGENVEENSPVEKPKRKRAAPKRKRSSAVPSTTDVVEGDEKAEESGEGRGEEGEEGERMIDSRLAETEPNSSSKAKKPKKKPKRGSRRWVGPRWDVIEKPED